MNSVKNFLSEAADSGKNLHLTHVDEDLFERGDTGARAAIESCRNIVGGLGTGETQLTLKWDGAPAVIAGKDPETGKFFVGTKGVFAQKPKINFTDKDIEENHPAEGLQDKLQLALKTLKGLTWNTVAQGDMLFSKSDLETVTIDGEECIVFKPNIT